MLDTGIPLDVWAGQDLATIITAFELVQLRNESE